MGIFDDIGKAIKKVEDDVRNSDLDRQLKNVEEGLNKVGKDVSTEIDKARAPAKPALAGVPDSTELPAPAPALPATASPDKTASRSPHPGYRKIVVWVRTNYHDRIAATGSYQATLALEQLSAEATQGLPAKARKGFLDYLKQQNYAPLLK